jgi:hypothetical protein
MDEGALTRALRSRASKIHTTLHTRAVPKPSKAGAARRTVLVASAWTILDAEDNPCADAAIYGCEFM